MNFLDQLVPLVKINIKVKMPTFKCMPTLTTKISHMPTI